ncbi:MAG TPA: HDOD domain-containing protein [Tepidisphaeraceae bacterium]|nr:HDOD domain-containing protein [Tepidisphaeraceae bacterium]
MSEQLQAKRVELILQQLDQLPTLPAVALRVLEVTADTDSSLMEVVKLIGSDQSLTTRILQLVHAAAAGAGHQVTSVERAIVMLGFEAVRSAVLAVSVFETLQGPPPKKPDSPMADGQFSREQFWRHCVAVACAAELLAEALIENEGPESGLPVPAEAFVCGLLHDIGKVALDAILPKSFTKVVEAADLLRANIADIERSVIGLDHMLVGKRLAEQWELPAALRDVIWLHGQHPQALPAAASNPRLINLITLADLIAREQHVGYSGNFTYPISRDELIAAIGLTPKTVDAKLAPLLERIERRATVLNLDCPSTYEMYQEAMKRANHELGRVSTQLALKTRRLATRAKFFDAMASLGGQLRPDSAPGAVLKAIGQTAVSILESGPIGVFSLMPGQSFAETVMLDANGDVFETTLVDCHRRPHSHMPGDGPVLPAGDELEWLLMAVGPMLAGESRFWINLISDGQCIGGVVWGAQAGEAQRLAAQVQELSTLAHGWQLTLRMSQVREESRLLAEQLAQANRQLQSARTEIDRGRLLVSIGEMAAGAAHEVNNPLAVIAGRSQLLVSQLSDPKQRALAQVILEQSNRISQIVSELMEYAKPVPPNNQLCDPTELIDRALHEAKARSESTDRNIDMTLGEMPRVFVDAKQVTAAMAEIIENALLATGGRDGRVDIRAAFDATGQRVAISVSDDGPGMDEATLHRAFDPFFSSKPAGRRRGMGLAKAQRWIEASGGRIRLESQAGRGTRALVLLPVAPPVTAAPPAPQERKAAS